MRDHVKRNATSSYNNKGMGGKSQMELQKHHMEQTEGYKILVTSSTGRVRGVEQSIRGTSLLVVGQIRITKMRSHHLEYAKALAQDS